MSKIAERLARLLALADLEEGADDARQNEARNAAMELLRTVKKHGVKIKFQIPVKDEPKAPPAAPDPFFRVPREPMPSGTYSSVDFERDRQRSVNFDDILRDFAAAGQAGASWAPPQPTGAKFPRVYRAIFSVECWRCKKKIKAGDQCRIEGPGKQPCHPDCQP